MANLIAILFYTYSVVGSGGIAIDTTPEPRFPSFAAAYYRGAFDLCIAITGGDLPGCYAMLLDAYNRELHLNETLDPYWSFEAIENYAE